MATSHAKTQARYNEHLAWLGSRTAGPPAASAPVISDQQQLLPLWESPQRSVPNGFMRSGLFRARDDSVSRGFERNVTVASLANYEIQFSGVPLIQDDLTVLISLLSLARGQHLEQRVVFSGYGLLRAMGWTINTRSYEKLRTSISNLKLAVLSIREKQADGMRRYDGNIIRDFACVSQTGSDNVPDGTREQWWVRFEPAIATLFVHDSTTLLEWPFRIRLGSKRPLAAFLHGFWSTHREPHPISIAKLHELAMSGSSLSVFRRSVKKALETLVTFGFLDSYTIESDMVQVIRARKRLAA